LRIPHSETAFIAWVGLRGAVSLLLALVPRIEGLPNGVAIFNSAFIIVVVSLVVQGWTIRPVARRLGLIIPPQIGPLEKVELDLPGSAHHELVVYHVIPDSPVARGERIPRWARPSLVLRNGQSMRAQYAGRIQADDYVYLFTAPRNTRLLDRLFASPARVDDDDKDFFGEFVIDTTRTLGDLGQAYGLTLPANPETTIGKYISDRLGGRVEIGDRVALGPIELIVRAADDGVVSSAGLVLQPEATTGARAPLLTVRNAAEILANRIWLLVNRWSRLRD
jgi:cell volume regulation protein A